MITLTRRNLLSTVVGLILAAGGAFPTLAQEPGTIVTVAGDGGVPRSVGGDGDGGPATLAEVGAVYGLAVDSAGVLYIADTSADGVLIVDRHGIITNLAGSVPGFSGDGGPATKAAFGYPLGIALDAAGNLFVADEINERVREISRDGIVSTVAGAPITVTQRYEDLGPGCRGAIYLGPWSTGFSGDGGAATEAALGNPTSVAVDAAGDIYVADGLNNRIRRIAPDGVITTVAGSGATGIVVSNCATVSSGGFSGDGGPATQAELNQPFAVAVGTAGNLFISDMGNGRVRRVDTNGIISTVAGGGSEAGDGGLATFARFGNNAPGALTVDAAGDLFIADMGTSRVREVTPDGAITTVAGNGSQGFSGDGGPAIAAALGSGPDALAIDRLGNLFISDGYRVREVYKVAAAGLVAGKPLSAEPLPGDVNGDGLVTSADVVLALRFAIGTLIPTNAQMRAADVHGDGRVTVADVTLILRFVVGLIDRFPVQE